MDKPQRDEPVQDETTAAASELQRAVARLLEPRLAADPLARDAVRALGRWLVAIADARESRSDAGIPAPSSAAEASASAPVRAAAPARNFPAPAPIRGPVEVVPPAPVVVEQLKLGLASGAVSPRVAEPAWGSARTESPALAGWSGGTDIADPGPIRLIAARSRLKAEGCDFALERELAAAMGIDSTAFRDRYEAFMERGKSLPDCFLWMVRRDAPVLGERGWSVVGACYANLAAAAESMVESLAGGGASAGASAVERDDFEQTLRLLAEAQSAVMVAHREAIDNGRDAKESDQLDAFIWVRERAERRRIYLDRYLSMSATAEPDAHADLAARLGELSARRRKRRDAERLRRNALGRVKHHARQLARVAPEEHVREWEKIEQGASEFIGAGGAPDDERAVEAISPAIAESPAGAAFLMGAATRRLVDAAAASARASEEADDADEADSAERTPTDEERRARALLEGKTVLFVGGERRAAHQRNLEHAFGLEEFRWATKRDHASNAPLEPEVARADVDLVIVAVRWCNTDTGPEVREMCRRHGKPCITLPGGYSRTSIAHAVVEQVSGRLAEAIESRG